MFYISELISTLEYQKVPCDAYFWPHYFSTAKEQHHFTVLKDIVQLCRKKEKKQLIELLVCSYV